MYCAPPCVVTCVLLCSDTTTVLGDEGRASSLVKGDIISFCNSRLCVANTFHVAVLPPNRSGGSVREQFGRVWYCTPL
ncbi:hypothetical protein J3A83DRAFT_4213702 [Scleroderma citrinum]